MPDLYGRVGGEHLVNTSKTGNQTEPRITALDNGGYVVVWTDQVTGSDYNSRGQVFANDGTPVGSEFLINTTNSTGNQFQPKVAALEGGGFVVTFTDSNGDGSANTGIRAQVFSDLGIAVGSEFSANQVGTGNQTLSGVTGLAGGGFVTYWLDPNTTSGDLVARIFTPGTNPGEFTAGNQFIANTTTTNSQRDAVGVQLSNGNFVLVFGDSGTSDGNGTSVRARIFEADGDAVSPADFPVNTTTTTGNQGNPSVAALKDGGFVVTWVDYSLLDGDPYVCAVKAQIFDNAGAKVGTEFLVNTYTHYYQEEPSVAALDSGGFIITFTDRSGYGGDTRDSGSKAIAGQIFDADGTKNGVQFLINTTIEQNQWLPTVAGLGNGGFAVAWVDASAVYDNTGYGIVSQVYAPSDGTITDIALSGTSVSETQAENTIVGTLSADGPTTTERTLTYTIVSDSTGGAFGIKGDKLIVADNAKLDFESAASAIVSVLVDDGQGHSYQEDFVIGVTDVATEVRWHAGNDIPVHTVRTADQSLQAMAALSDGYVVTWTDSGLTLGDATGQAIHGQRFDNAGNKVGGEFLVNTSTTGNQTASSVVGTGDGGFLVVWQDSGVSPSAIRGQFYNTDGDRIGTEFQIDDGVGAASIPEVTLLGSGNYLVAWQDAAGDSGTTGTTPLVGVRGQLVSLTGETVEKVGAEFTLNTQANAAQGDPAIATTATGFVAIWTDANSSGVIRAQFFDNAGTKTGSEFQVNTNSAMNQLKPTATVLSNGDVLFTWWDLSNVGGDTANGGIKGRIYNSDGTIARTAEFLMNTTVALDQDAPRVAALPTGGFMLVFEDRSEYMLGNIRAQQFDNAGTKIGGEFIANYDTNWAQKVPTIALLSNGDIAISWYDGKNIGSDTNGWDVETRVFSPALATADTIANADTVQAAPGSPATFLASQLLGNDSSSFGTLVIERVIGGTGGTVTLNPDGSVTFTPGLGFSGGSFSYVANNGEGGTATGTVTVELANTPPTEAANAGATVAEGGTTTLSAAMLAYDDAEQGDAAITYTLTSATNGAVALSGTPLGTNGTFTQDDIDNGRVTFVHDGSETTSAAFGFTVSDGAGSIVAGQSFSIGVTPSDDAPVAANDLFATDELTAESGDLFADNGSGVDGDVDGPALAITAVNGSALNVGTQITLASGALLTVNADGTFSYDPNGAFEHVPDSASGGSNLIDTDSFTYTLGGNTATVTIDVTGVDNDDVVQGSPGPDILDGGVGTNTLSYANATAGVFGNIGTASSNDTVGAGTDMVANFQNLTGSDFVDELRGSMDANILDGGLGADVMLGWYGDDIYIVDDAGDSIREAAGQGTDTVRSPVSYVLPDREVENLTLTGTGDISGSGNQYANLLTGNGGANSLAGYGGNDRIDGGEGADLMAGGIGNDTYVVDNAGDRIKESDGQGDDTVETSIDFTLPGVEVERVVVTGSGAVNVTGNAIANVLTGNGAVNWLYGAGGDDRIDGGDGADVMAGGLGNDTFVVDDAGDRIKENAGQGTDTVETALAFSLQGLEVENLTLTGGGAVDGIGNGLENLIRGNGAANSLLGYDGNDDLRGGGGDDALHGMAGNDTMEGGAGADRFYFDADLGTGNVDTITDFEAGLDSIWLRRIKFDGVSLTGTLAEDMFVIGSEAADAGDRIIYDSATGALYFDPDGTGAAAAVQFATLGTGLPLTHANFTLF